MKTSAPSFWKPFRCWSMGRTPVAHPPGRATLATPGRASSGPSTGTEGGLGRGGRPPPAEVALDPVGAAAGRDAGEARGRHRGGERPGLLLADLHQEPARPLEDWGSPRHDPPEHRHPVGAAVEGGAGLVARDLGRQRGNDRARQVRRGGPPPPHAPPGRPPPRPPTPPPRPAAR